MKLTRIRDLYKNIEAYLCLLYTSVTLHACDTATDFALAKAVGWKAKVILSVPCCQHELNGQMENELLRPILQYGLIKERPVSYTHLDVYKRQGYQDAVHPAGRGFLRPGRRAGIFCYVLQ